jgi:hypothetical protein
MKQLVANSPIGVFYYIFTNEANFRGYEIEMFREAGHARRLSQHEQRNMRL